MRGGVRRPLHSPLPGVTQPLVPPCACARGMQVEAALCSALQGLRNEMLVWSKDERLWQRTWGTLLSQVEGL